MTALKLASIVPLIPQIPAPNPRDTPSALATGHRAPQVYPRFTANLKRDHTRQKPPFSWEEAGTRPGNRAAVLPACPWRCGLPLLGVCPRQYCAGCPLGGVSRYRSLRFSPTNPKAFVFPGRGVCKHAGAGGAYFANQTWPFAFGPVTRVCRIFRVTSACWERARIRSRCVALCWDNPIGEVSAPDPTAPTLPHTQDLGGWAVRDSHDCWRAGAGRLSSAFAF